MSKLINFFKNLFKKDSIQSETKNKVCSCTDVFGNEIDSDDIVYAVKYNELNRRGYITFEDKPIELNELTSDNMQNGLISYRTINLKAMAGKVKASRRNGFFHVY